MNFFLFLFLKINHVTVTDGDGSSPETHMFAKYPCSPSDSVSSSPAPRRRIRCKMCRYVWTFFSNAFFHLVVRQELATREHMLDHGQLGPATPVDSPVGSRRSSSSSSQFANPTLAALRPTTNTPVSPISVTNNNNKSPPILLNTKCSGYFVEPVSFHYYIYSPSLTTCTFFIL